MSNTLATCRVDIHNHDMDIPKNVCLYCSGIGPKRSSNGTEKLTRCMGIDALRVLDSIGTSVLKEAEKQGIDLELKPLKAQSAGCLSRQGEDVPTDVPIFFHQSCVPGGARDSKTSNRNMIWSHSKSKEDSGFLFALQPLVLHRLCAACVQHYKANGGSMVEGVAATADLEATRQCKRATHHIKGIKCRLEELSNSERSSVAFVFGEAKIIAIIPPFVQSILNKKPSLASRLASVTEEIFQEIKQLRESESPPLNPLNPSCSALPRTHPRPRHPLPPHPLPPLPPVVSPTAALPHLPLSQRGKGPHHGPHPSTHSTPAPQRGITRGLPVQSHVPSFSAIHHTALSNEVELQDQQDAENPLPSSFLHPLSIPGISSDRVPPSHSMLLPCANLSTTDMFPVSLPRSDGAFGCSGSFEVDGMSVQLPSLISSVATSRHVSQRLPGHPPYTPGQLATGGSLLIPQMTRAQCEGTLRGYYDESLPLDGRHAESARKLQERVAQAVAQAQATGIA